MQIRLALAKGRVARKAIELLQKIGYIFEDYDEKSRKLIFQDTTGAIEFFLVKSPDVPTYVEKVAADIVYELLNLDIGQCKMCVAGFKDSKPQFGKKLVVGTKYPAIAKDYFNSKDEPVDLIKINGSVELAPLLGLSDCIVDIVESGSTLRENGLVVLEEICDISSRLIVNKVSLKTKGAMIDPIIERFEANLSIN